MAYPENNEKNRHEVATKILSGWDREALEAYVRDALVDDYSYAPDIFEETWDDIKDSFEWSEELCESIKKNCPNPGCHCMACEKEDDEKWKTKEALEGRR